jgi:uncharacterized protein with NAD-binding domain and iron-sulfur cluster
VIKVLILGGGVAGLSAAQELAQRGFAVEIWEASGAVGGRAKSRIVDGLPTEHGFHFFPAFYRHLRDTLARVPDESLIAANPKSNLAWLPGQSFSPQSVTEQLVASSRVVLARDGKTELPFDFDVRSWGDALGMAQSFARLGLSPAEVGLALGKLGEVVMAIRTGTEDSLESVTWWDFIEADSQSTAYQEYFGKVAVRWTVAMDPHKASARTIGRIAIQFWMTLAASNAAGRSGNGASTSTPRAPFAQVLSGPTSTTWLDPWGTYLEQRLNVRIRKHRSVLTIECANHREVSEIVAYQEDGTLTKAIVRNRDSRDGAPAANEFDYCICALPIPALSKIVDRSPELRDSEPSLRKIPDLRRSMNWMVGIQFFLKKDVPVARGGIMLRDSPWALTATSQLQFWKQKVWELTAGGVAIQRPPFLAKPADRLVKGVLSVIISDWDKRGHFQDRTARSSTEEQLFWEVWQELKAHLNNQPDAGGEFRGPVLEDENLIGYHLSIQRKRERRLLSEVRTKSGNWASSIESCLDLLAEVIETAPFDDIRFASLIGVLREFIESAQKDSKDAAGSGYLQRVLEVMKNIAREDLAQRRQFNEDIVNAVYPQQEERWINPEPLFINTVDSLTKRPEAVTGLRNFFLAGDYVRTYTDLATMEAANESARRAVNGILEDAESPSDRCEVWPLELPLLSIGATGLQRGVVAVGNAGKKGLGSALSLLKSIRSNWRKGS